MATLVVRLRSALCFSSTKAQEHSQRGQTPERYSTCPRMVADIQIQLSSPRYQGLLDTGGEKSQSFTELLLIQIR